MNTRLYVIAAVSAVATLFCTSVAAQDQGALYRVSLDGTADFSRYDIETNTWTTLTDFATSSQLATSADGRLFGWNNTAGEIQEYDPGSDTWSFVQSAPPTTDSYGNLEYRSNGEWVYSRTNDSTLYYTVAGAWQTQALPFAANAVGDYDPASDTLVIGEFRTSHFHAVDMATLAVTAFTQDGLNNGERSRCGQIRDGRFYYQTHSNPLRFIDLSNNAAMPVDVAPSMGFFPSCAVSEVVNHLFVNSLNGMTLVDLSLEDASTVALAGHTSLGNHSSVTWVGESTYVAEGPVNFAVSANFGGGVDPDLAPQVTIVCNSGLPLTQTAPIGVTFTVQEILPGSVCTIELAEDFDSGWILNGALSNGTPTGDICEFTVTPGQANYCVFNAEPAPLDFTVHFDWEISDEADEGIGLNAQIHWMCSNVWDVDTASLTTISGYGSGVPGATPNPLLIPFAPSPYGNTGCSAYMDNVNSGVVVDNSDCGPSEIPAVIGGTAPECTIYATAFYEGIPTLSQYGMAIMALLMLGVGLIGFRRFA